MGEGQAAAVLGGSVEEVARLAEEDAQGHDELLAEGIDGGVGHLGEELLEIVEEELGPIGEDRQLLVVPHGADGLLPPGSHGADYHLQVFFAVAEGVLFAQEELRVLRAG